jgi:hypothetical protein
MGAGGLHGRELKHSTAKLDVADAVADTAIQRGPPRRQKYRTLESVSLENVKRCANMSGLPRIDAVKTPSKMRHVFTSLPVMISMP